MGLGTRFCITRLLAFAVLLEIILIPAIMYWPIFEENVAIAKKLVPFLKGKDVMGLMEVTGVTGYVIGQQFFKGCIFGGLLAAVLFSMNAVAGEARRGTLEIWLARMGFVDVRTVDESVTSTDEQRSTDWMRFQSLPDFLDPHDATRTLEGYPAPRRAVLVATRPG